MTGLTFDTGALIGLERRRQRISRVYTTAVADQLIVTVPTAVIAEWWRGRSDARETILRGVRVEPLDAELAKVAGEALAHVRPASAVDALVMASAARRGDIVYTSDRPYQLTTEKRFSYNRRRFPCCDNTVGDHKPTGTCKSVPDLDSRKPSRKFDPSSRKSEPIQFRRPPQAGSDWLHQH